MSCKDSSSFVCSNTSDQFYRLRYIRYDHRYGPDVPAITRIFSPGMALDARSFGDDLARKGFILRKTEKTNNPPDLVIDWRHDSYVSESGDYELSVLYGVPIPGSGIIPAGPNETIGTSFQIEGLEVMVKR